MSLIIISMMTIVALSVVYADNGGCPCNKGNEGYVPAPLEDVENTEGDVQPLGECMRTWIEKDCGPKVYYDPEFVSCRHYATDKPKYLVVWNWHWYRYCEKWRVWYDICQHKELYREYLGVFRESGTKLEDCICPSCNCLCWP